MASQLKNILSFNIPGGGSQTLPHNLNIQGEPLIPDVIEFDASGFEVTADAFNVTVKGVGSVDVLVESWHTIERVFGDVAITHLTPQPFVVDGGGSGSVPTPPFDVTTVFIYARTTGSDITGDGSLANPYATFQRAIRDVPNIPAPGVNYTIDITGITENLPAGYQTPVIISSGPGAFFGNASPAPWYTYGGGITVTATPQLATSLTPAAAVVSAADAATVVVGAGAAKLVAINVGVARPSWAGNALKGLFLVRSVKSGTSNNTTCAIYGSDANNIYVANDATTLNGGAGPLVLSAGEQLQIVQPSATFTGASFQCWEIAAPNFQGINFSSGLNFGPNTAFVPVCELCVLNGCFLGANAGNGIELLGCSFTTNFIAQPAPTVISRCLFSGMGGNPFNFYFAVALQTFMDVVFDNTCPSLTPGSFEGAILPNNWGLQNVYFQGSQGDAIAATYGEWGLLNVQIDNTVAANGTQGNAITASGGGATFMTLTNVAGGNTGPTANAGYGVRAIQGSRVLADPATMVDPTAVTGALGTTKSGGLGVTTWTQVAGGFAYDLPTNAASIQMATGTCIRSIDTV
jgi:hypothetical protein